MTKPDIGQFVQEADEHARFAAAYLKARASLAWYRRLLQTGHEWLPAFRLLHPEADAKEALTRLRAIAAEAAVHVVESEKRAGPYLRRRNFPTLPAAWARSPVALAIQSDQVVGNCPPASGLARYPAAATHLPWAPPQVSGNHLTRGGANWTLVARQNWYELEPSVDVGFWNPGQAEGVAFSASVTQTPETTILDVLAALVSSGGTLTVPESANTLGSIFCLQYTFPAAACDAVLHWETTAYALYPRGVEMNGDRGFASLAFVICEQTPISGFPGFDRYRWVEPARNQANSTSGRMEVAANLAGSFNVSAGNASCLYIGVSCYLTALNGSTCTSSCITSPSDRLWHDGLFFLWYSPANVFSYPVPGVSWAISPR